jgi:GNAT superfamily N-acetyltransferase
VTAAPRDTGELRVSPRDFDDPHVRRLVDALLDDLTARYGGEDGAPPTTGDQFAPPEGVFLVAELDGEPVGCGGIRPAAPATAEIKRMYVVPDRRGRGIARTLLAALEDAARARGYRELRLETGVSQPEAIALYTASGYAPTEPFGYYARFPNARFYAKAL